MTSNFKIKCSDLVESRKLLDHAYSLGYTWAGGQTNIPETIYLSFSDFIRYNTDLESFKANIKPEIRAQDFFTFPFKPNEDTIQHYHNIFKQSREMKAPTTPIGEEPKKQLREFSWVLDSDIQPNLYKKRKFIKVNI